MRTRIVTSIGHLLRNIFKWLYGYCTLPLLRLIFRISKYKHKPLDLGCKKVIVNFTEHTNVGLGDAVIYDTIIKILKHRFPTARIFLLIEKRNRFFDVYWKKHSLVDEFFLHPPLSLRYVFHWIVFFVKFQRARFDFSIIQSIEPVRGLDSTWFPLDPAITFFCRVKNIVGFYDRWDENCFYSSIVSQLGVDQLPPDTPGPHWTGPHWTDIAAEYGKALKIPETEISLVCKPHFNFQHMPLPVASESRFRISVNPGGDKIWNRRWPLDKYVELCIKASSELDASIFLVGGPEEKELRDELRTKVIEQNPFAKVFVINPKTLNETANFIAQSDVFIGNDSGVTHLATAIGVPIIAIYGPSNFAFWGPHKINARNKVVSLALPCMPCEHQLNLTGIADCHLTSDKYKCLNDLGIEQVYTAVEQQLR